MNSHFKSFCPLVAFGANMAGINRAMVGKGNKRSKKFKNLINNNNKKTFFKEECTKANVVGEHYTFLCTISKTPDPYVEITLKSKPVAIIMSTRLNLESIANILRSALHLSSGNKSSRMMRSRGYTETCGDNALSQKKISFFYKTC